MVGCYCPLRCLSTGVSLVEAKYELLKNKNDHLSLGHHHADRSDSQDVGMIIT